jgi:hypothetical protein|uniref:hypothetical protein n=1 Tax=Cyanobium sp. TaxID=2164130 RepID=UPI004049FE0C
MDNITKGFVIAACSDVIAVGGVWLDGRHRYSKALQTCMALTYPSSEPLALPADKQALFTYCSEKVQFVGN